MSLQQSEKEITAFGKMNTTAE